MFLREKSRFTSTAGYFVNVASGALLCKTAKEDADSEAENAEAKLFLSLHLCYRRSEGMNCSLLGLHVLARLPVADSAEISPPTR